MKMSRRSIKKAKRGAEGKPSRSNRRATERLNSRIFAFEKAVGGKTDNSGYTKPGAIDRY